MSQYGYWAGGPQIRAERLARVQHAILRKCAYLSISSEGLLPVKSYNDATGKAVTEDSSGYNVHSVPLEAIRVH